MTEINKQMQNILIDIKKDLLIKLNYLTFHEKKDEDIFDLTNDCIECLANVIKLDENLTFEIGDSENENDILIAEIKNNYIDICRFYKEIN